VARQLPWRELLARDGRAAHQLCRLPYRALCVCRDRASALSFLAGRDPDVLRGCSAPLSYEGDRWPGKVHVLIGSMDRPEDFVPARDAFAEEKLRWVPLVPSPGR
jgi:hypothetical protein